MRGVAWSGRRIGLLKELWAAGMTATDIAARLRISRAAVLGKMFRLRLGPVRGAKLSKTKPDAASLGRRRRGRRYAEVEIKPAAPVAPAIARGKTLFELTNHSCRWPIGSPGTPGFRFCGEAGADLENARPYCERHAKRAYVKPAKPAEQTSRGSGSGGIAMVKSPPTAPAEPWQRIIFNLLGRRT
jgi:GcrA cell cycle regulator